MSSTPPQEQAGRLVGRPPPPGTQHQLDAGPVDEWDMALNFEELHISRGRVEGLREGRVRGQEDGVRQGLAQGLQLGQELGWFWGCTLVWQALLEASCQPPPEQGLGEAWSEASATRSAAACLRRPPPFSDRAKRSLVQLQSLIRNFPVLAALEDDPEGQSTEDASLEEHLQALRARFCSTASAFGASPLRPDFLRRPGSSSSAAGTAGAVPSRGGVAAAGSLDF